MIAESYFDETNTHRGDQHLCVGGYVFYKEAAEKQASRWAGLLTKWNLPFFHIVECAHNVGVFKHLTANECDLAAREAIQIIKETASVGICITVLESEYQEIMPPLKFIGSAYDTCARDAIAGVASWIASSNFVGPMYYYFEEGTHTENNASYRIKEMMKEPDIRREAHYAGHNFVPKMRSPGIQAADILAWHAGQDCKRALRGERSRKDFNSLCEITHKVLHLDRRKLEERASLILEELNSIGATIEMANTLEDIERRNRR